MKRLYLVKGEERIEVTRSCESGWLCLKENGWRSTQQFVESIGYTLEEVEERREYWEYRMTSEDFILETTKKKHTELPKDTKVTHFVELKEGEIIVDRGKIELAWEEARIYNSTCSETYENFCEKLGLLKEKE